MADEFLGVAKPASGTAENAFSRHGGNKGAEAICGKPLTGMEATKVLSRVPFNIIKLTAGAPALSKDEESAIVD